VLFHGDCVGGSWAPYLGLFKPSFLCYFLDLLHKISASRIRAYLLICFSDLILSSDPWLWLVALPFL
jgi:hypothetical protein